MHQTTLHTKTTTRPTRLYLALELASSDWLLLFSNGTKEREVSIPADGKRLVTELAKAKEKLGLKPSAPVASCYEAGRDGFWVHRALVEAGVDSRVIDAASIELDRKQRHVKTDRVDARKLLRLLMRYEGGERDALRVLRVPSEKMEDARRPARELERLKKESTQHRNRIGSLLKLHGIGEWKLGELEEKADWNGKPLPPAVTAELLRERERLQLVEKQARAIEKERSQALKEAQSPHPLTSKVLSMMHLCGIGSGSSWLLVGEFFAWRKFGNRRQVASAAGLACAPHSSGDLDRSQGIDKAGNARVRTMMVQLSWMWLRLQPNSAISIWFHERFGKGKRSRRIGIVAVARKLLIALWRFVEHGVVPTGARLKAAD